MITETDLNNLKLLLNIADTSKDALLSLVYDGAASNFFEYTNQVEIPNAANSLIVKMAIVDYNRLGSQGLNSQSYSGVSESYINGYPADILSSLNKYRKLKVL